MSTIGDAQRVRHLRAGALSWAVWTFDDDGHGQRFAVRQRTGNVAFIPPITGLRTDGPEFSERVIPLPPMRVHDFHCLELAANQVLFFFEDGRFLYTFTWDVVGNTILTPVTLFAVGDVPSQFEVGGIVRQFYERDGHVYVRVAGGAESRIIDLSGTEVLEDDVVRKAVSAFARYAGTHAINRDLALPFQADANTIFCYDMTTAIASVTEALPPGVVSYYTFDDANYSGSTILDQAGSNNGTLVSSAPASVAGQVNQARLFPSGSGSGYYNLGNPSNLRITGDLSLAFWFRMAALNSYHHPIHKAYGGEYTSIIYDAGDGYFYYGTAGANAAPYAWLYFPPGTVPFDVWTHMAFVRDLVNRRMTLFVNGVPTIQVAAPFAAAVADASNSFFIGNAPNWTNVNLAGRLDELLIANQAWSAESVAALYAKGVAGVKANVSGSGSVRRLVDSGPSARHAPLTASGLVTAQGVAAVADARTSLIAVQSQGYSLGAAFTIEARLVPRWGVPGERAVLSNRVFGYTTGAHLQGLFEFVYAPDGLITLRFETASATVELRQTGGARLRVNELNYIAVSHTFGVGAASFLIVNGNQVPAIWVGGSGNESPTVLAAAPSIAINPGDELLGLRLSNIAKPISTIRDYLRGRS